MERQLLTASLASQIDEERGMTTTGELSSTILRLEPLNAAMEM
jgi:hypothetical protein